jgi:hypothetical protein
MNIKRNFVTLMSVIIIGMSTIACSGGGSPEYVEPSEYQAE